MQISIGNVVEQLEALVVASDNFVALLGTKLVPTILAELKYKYLYHRNLFNKEPAIQAFSEKKDYRNDFKSCSFLLEF